MAKRTVLAIIAVFIAWSVLDFIIHGMLLQSSYEATAQLWRPMEEMKMSLMYFVTFLFTATFVLIYALLISEKSLASGLKFGTLFGIAIGLSMGFGSYSSMPIPLMLAWSWFFGSLIEALVAGVIVGAIVKS